MDVRDRALQASCPTVAMPSFGPLYSLEQGQRMVLGRNGLFLQFKNPWLECSVAVGRLDPCMRLPYGEVREEVGFAFGVVPLPLLEEFISHGRDACPRETAGALIYNVTTAALTLRMHEILEASAAHVRYRIPELADDELLAVDLHTHGRSRAFFSKTDDDDDVGVRVCGVFGNLDRATPSACFRLIVNGVKVPMASPWE